MKNLKYPVNTWKFYTLYVLMCCTPILGFAQKTNKNSNWATYNRTYEGDRYSPLAQIDTKNVASLHLLHEFDLGADKATMQTGPVVIDGHMYFTTDTVTYAINAATGKLIWKYSRPVKATGGLGSNRGVAYYDGKLFRGTGDAHVIALNAKTGKLIWDVPIDIAGTPGVSIPMAPIAWDNKVFISHAGGDQTGITGHVYALDVNTGKTIWTLDVVPESVHYTWPGRDKGLPATGGCSWTSFSLDEKESVLYVPTGNPAPDLDAELRGGDNLYSSCVLAVDARTGKMIAYNQLVKNDFHDWDVTASPVVLTTRSGKKIIASASKDGLLHILDRSDIKSKHDQSKGIPTIYTVPITERVNADKPLSRTEWTYFKPGFYGGAEWNGAAYHPEYNLIYTCAADLGVKVKLSPIDVALKNIPKTGEVWFGGEMEFDDFSTARGWIYAVNAENGNIEWRYQTSGPAWAGITPTAGGIIFTASFYGEVFAFDAKNGDILWQGNTGLNNGGGVITYEVDGRQYLAVVAGIKNSLYKNPNQDSKIMIYGL